jgi:hypothetical protein
MSFFFVSTTDFSKRGEIFLARREMLSFFAQNANGTCPEIKKAEFVEGVVYMLWAVAATGRSVERGSGKAFCRILREPPCLLRAALCPNQEAAGRNLTLYAAILRLAAQQKV